MNADLRTTAWRRGARTIKKIRPRPAVAAGGLAAAAVLTASLAGAPFAQASVASAGPAVTGHTVETNGPAAAYAAHVRAYWTRDRMLSARNADAVASKSAHVKNPGAGTREPGKTGQPGHVAGTAPTQRLGGGIKSVPQSHRATPAYGSSGTVWPGSPYLPPATTTGKVFFTTNNGARWVCSASTVNSNGKDAVITAAHCVYGNLGGEAPGEGWHSNWVFVPDYNNGNAPYGTWTARQLWTLTNYINNGGSMADEADDIGTAVMNTNGYGQHIVNVVGGQGIEWNYPYQYVYDFGYPAQPPFTGQVLDYCSGWEFGWYPGTMGLNCNFNGGSSGGPWLASFNGEWGYINGINDFGYPSLPNSIFSAYFASNAGNLYNAVAGL